MRRRLLAVLLSWAAAASSSGGAEAVHYRFSFPQPARQWMQVEAAFADLPAEPLELWMSRSSPGRYAAQDFAKGIYDVHAYAPDGRELRLERRDPSIWSVATHTGRVTVKYKVYGDRLDGTYLAIDATHAHINMPAALMWARGFDDRPATLRFDPPAGADAWEIATQLYPGPSPREFTAPNLQYLIDSPVEFGPVMVETFAVGAQSFRFAAHHTGTRMELKALVGDVAKIVEEEKAIFGEFPAFDSGPYTFISDYLPSAVGDAMEHRNSAVITWPGTIRNSRETMLDAAAHEFFHAWNVERIRPQSLEPFDLTRPNASGELWLAEGFTQYYGPLVMRRAGLIDVPSTARTITMVLNAISAGAGRLLRSAEEVSRLAPVVERFDGSSSSADVVSYYYLGAAIALALDLSLRERSNSELTLDDFMRAMWREYGKPGGTRPGYVDRPYTVADAEAALASVSNDRAFARDFFDRYVRGRELADYGRLLGLAGFAVRPAPRGRVEVVPIESVGRSLPMAQRTFRNQWLESE
jgi:predicted metalloprotease with PDZ domain